MKRQLLNQLSGVLLGGLIVLAMPMSVGAQAVNTRAAAASTAATVKTQIATDRVSKLQAKALAEIDRRLSILNDVLPRLSAMTMISTESKNVLMAEISQSITNLTQLRTQVTGVTELTSLKTLIKGITDGYKTFGVIYPRIHLLLLADKQLARIGSTMEIVTKLQSQTVGMDATSAISGQAGTNVGGVIKLLNSAQTQLVGMKERTNKVVTSLVELKVTGAVANRTVMQSARQTLAANNSDLAKLIGSLKGSLGVFRSLVNKGEASNSGVTTR